MAITLNDLLDQHFSTNERRALRKSARQVISVLVNELRSRRGETVQVPGLGTFKVTKKKGRNYRHPSTGVMTWTGPKTAVKFKASKNIFSFPVITEVSK